MRKVILSGAEARTRLAEGARKLAKGVGSTYGPFGANWFLDKRDAITNDGVTVAREFELPDEVENRGAKAMREAAIKTDDQVGDGTTTATILEYAIYEAASKFFKSGVIGNKPLIDTINQIENERKEVTEKLIASATPIETEQQLIDSAIVSVEDKEIGMLIGSAQWKLGKDGVLIAEDSNESTSSVEFVNGIRIDNGVGSGGLINNLEKQTFEMDDVYILLTSHTLKEVKQWEMLTPLFEQAHSQGIRKLLIMARGWTDEVLNCALRQNVNGTFRVYPLNSPYLDMTQRFKDLAAVTGAYFYDSESSTLEDFQVSGIGKIQKVIAKRMETYVIGEETDKNKENIKKRVDELQQQLSGSESEFEKKLLRERIAQMTNGFGIVKVGASSAMEKQRLLAKVNDAVNAVRVAFEEGTVKGGGLAYKEIADSLPETYLLKRPLMAPYEQLMSRAPEGFVIEDWVRNPLKVERVALENACSGASAFATADGVITVEFPKQLDEMLKSKQS